ncbi:MAG: nucleotidyltransferase family protein [Bacteroidaceae bacterium]
MNSAFQELILISLGKRDRFSTEPTEKDWLAIYNEAQRQCLLGILLTGVEKVVATGTAKPSFLVQWIGMVMNLEQKNNLLNVRCREITEMFRMEGYRSCVLKGQGVALLYPNPLRRQSGDIDLWVDGSRDEIYNLLKRRWSVQKAVIHHADVKIFPDTATEIHFVPSFAYSPFRYRRYKNFFKQYADRQFGHYDKGVGFVYPEVVFNAVYSMMHIFHHVLHEGIGLRQLMDYYYILCNLDSEQRDVVFERLKYLGLSKFAAAVMYVVQRMFELDDEYLLCKPNEKVGVLLLSEIKLSGNFGHYDVRNLGVNRQRRLAVYWHNICRNVAFFQFAPSEVLWAPIWKPCHFLWRKYKRYQ